jgi:hypothetical protein
MIGDYFEFLKKVAKKSPSVKNFRLIREFIGVNRGFIRIELRDDSELHVFEYVDSSLHKIDYSYHWQDREKHLITRWDTIAKSKLFPITCISEKMLSHPKSQHL